jgi:hypothetical protein
MTTSQFSKSHPTKEHFTLDVVKQTVHHNYVVRYTIA